MHTGAEDKTLKSAIFAQLLHLRALTSLLRQSTKTLPLPQTLTNSQTKTQCLNADIYTDNTV